jgi:mannose-6-phosphate isomerase class I
MKLSPYYIVPLLIEQPTWGGEYIVGFKGIQDPSLTGKKIGQAFELAVDSQLSDLQSSSPAFGFATATDIAHPQWIGDQPSLSLQSLIDQDAVAVLGQRALEKFGPKMNVLIKFTQAKNNSYQVHVKPGQEFGHWLAKPESWFYFEKGKATLGLAPGASVDEYRQRCEVIDAFANQLSQKIKAGELALADGKHQLTEFINQDHPRRFVNTVEIEPGQIIDLSLGGTHHSWEVSDDTPLGNIVYEVQVDVRDENCTLRSFDQGNIKDDGSVRPLTINDYFEALNSEPAANRPEQYMTVAQPQTDGLAQVTTLFDNQYYKTTQLSFTGECSGPSTKTSGSFHHVFVQEGSVTVKTSSGQWPINKGWSLFIPAGVEAYSLIAEQQSTVLTTSI